MWCFDTETADGGVYGIMNSKLALMVVGTLLILGVALLLVRRGESRVTSQEPSRWMATAPDGTIELPRNDRMTIVADLPQRTTNSNPAPRSGLTK